MLSDVVQKAIQDPKFAEELRKAAMAAEGKKLESAEVKHLHDYFGDPSGAALSVGNVQWGLTTTTTTTTYTTAACTTTGTTTTTTTN